MEHVTALNSVEANEELLLEHVPQGTIYIYVSVYENILYIYIYIYKMLQSISLNLLVLELAAYLFMKQVGESFLKIVVI